jgi:DNA-binding MarR family transcriptional regulator
MPNNSTKLISLMTVIGRRMREEMKKQEGKRPYSLLHLETLRYVEDNQRPLMRDVAAHFSITPPAATLLVDGLVTNKFLKRLVDARDRRAVRITLTTKGRQLLTRGVEDRMQKIKEVFSVLDEKERAELVRILGKIAKYS